MTFCLHTLNNICRAKDKLENVRNEITAKFPDVKVAVYAVDIQDQNQVENAVKAAISDLGQIDILINNVSTVYPLGNALDKSNAKDMEGWPRPRRSC